MIGFLNTNPRLENESVEPSQAGWGEIFNFTVYVWDPEGGNVTVDGWWSEPPYDTWNGIRYTKKSSQRQLRNLVI